MKLSEARLKFKIGLDKIDTESYPDILPEEIDYFLTEAYERWIKTRYDGNTVSQRGFEQSQKRRDDLALLVTRGYVPLVVVDGNTKKFSFSTIYTTDEMSDLHTAKYKFYLSSRVNITIGRGPSINKWVEPTLAQIDDIATLQDDPFNNSWLLEPLMTQEEGTFFLHMGDNFNCDKALVIFIKQQNPLPVNVNDQAFETAQHTHREIVELAITIALETVESQRINTQPQIMNGVNGSE
jgi:hypothetical protein